MPDKQFMTLRARAVNENVLLTCYKTTPAFRAEDRRGDWDVRILRRHERGFVFGDDYAEYFDGLDPRDAEVIFEGRLAADNGRKFHYVDEHVQCGATYTYWTEACHGGDATGPVPVKVRDGRVWWPYEKVVERLEYLCSAHPELVQALALGSSVQGRPILGVTAGNRRKMIGLVGAVHAGESGPELWVPCLERLAAEMPELLREAGVACVPTVNVDCREQQARGTPWYIRCNANGVDLNRNFPADWDTVELGYGYDSSDPDSGTYRGPTPGSEPETQAVMRFIEQCRPLAVFSSHCLAGICGDSFLAALGAAADSAYTDCCRHWAERYARGMYPDAESDPTVSYACTSGSLPHWLFREHGIPAFDLEFGTNEDARPCVTDETTPELLAAYQDRHFRALVAMLEQLAASPS